MRPGLEILLSLNPANKTLVPRFIWTGIKSLSLVNAERQGVERVERYCEPSQGRQHAPLVPLVTSPEDRRSITKQPQEIPREAYGSRGCELGASEDARDLRRVPGFAGARRVTLSVQVPCDTLQTLATVAQIANHRHEVAIRSSSIAPVCFACTLRALASCFEREIIAALRQRGTKFASAILVDLERVLRSLANTAHFIFGDHGQKLNRKSVRVRIIAADELDAGRVQQREDGHRARQSIKFAHDECRLRPLSVRDCRSQLRAVVERISLAGFNLAIGSKKIAAVCLHMLGDSGDLRLDSQAGVALFVGAHPHVGNHFALHGPTLQHLQRSVKIVSRKNMPCRMVPGPRSPLQTESARPSSRDRVQCSCPPHAQVGAIPTSAQATPVMGPILTGAEARNPLDYAQHFFAARPNGRITKSLRYFFRLSKVVPVFA